MEEYAAHVAGNQRAQSGSFKVWKTSAPGLGSVLVGEIGADSGIQRPGELRQTRLQDTDTITGLAVMLIFINSHPRTLAREGKSGAPLESHADV